jgi:hypothetical protein
MGVRFARNDQDADFVQVKTCPAYQAQITKLWSARQHSGPSANNVQGVRAGPFVFAGRSDLFDLQGSKGRQAAAQWVRETLAEVRPCWNNFREDQTRYAVDHLYSALAMRPH